MEKKQLKTWDSVKSQALYFRKKLIYKIMIRPHLDYIDFVVDSGSFDRVLKLDRLKKKALHRIEYCINLKDRQDTDVLMVKYNIEEIRLRRKGNLVKIMYPQSQSIENLKTTSVERTLRSANKIKHFTT